MQHQGNTPPAGADDDAAGPWLFRGLDQPSVDAIVRAGSLTRRKRGEFFFRQSQPSDRFYLLRSGRIKLTQLTPDGELVLVRLVAPGEAFGGVALFGHRTYPVSAQAAADAQAIGWSGRLIASLMQRHPRLAMNTIELLAGRVQDLQERFQELATQQVERRLARTLLRLVRQAGRRVDGGVLIDIVLSRQDLAEMTGTTLFTVSRLLRQWDQRGVVRATRQRVLVRQPHALVSIAEELP
jgi:CRP-like cAMP-binding protein